VLTSHIGDGTGTNEKVKVSEESLHVVALPYPPFKEQKILPLRQYLTTDGTPSGSNNMVVVGSGAAPISFYIKAHEHYDRYITNLSVLIADAGAVLSQFGSLPVLTNGCRVYYERNSGIVELHEGIKTNFEFLRFALFQPAFGTGSNAFQVTNVIGTSESYMPVIELSKLVPPFGVKLDAGTTQKLVIEIRDNLTGMDALNVIAYGFDRFKKIEG